MALVRPGVDSQLQAAPKEEPTLEPQLVDQIRQIGLTVSQIRDAQAEMRIQLLGSKEEETKHGRLPMVESDISTLKEEVKTLREDKIRWKGYLAGATAVGSIVGGVMGALMGFFGHLLIEMGKR